MKIRLLIVVILAIGLMHASEISELINQAKTLPDSSAVLKLNEARDMARSGDDIEMEIVVLRALFERYNRMGDRDSAIKVIDRIFDLYKMKNEALYESNRMRYWKIRVAIIVGLSVFVVLIITMLVILMRRNKQQDVNQKEIEKANRKLNETISKLEAASPHDAVTGLLTANAMLERIKYEEIRYERNQIDFTFIVCEIDDFEELKSEHGMPVAEHVLKSIGTMIRESVRKQDIVGRWHEARYLFLLPQTNPHGATVIAEKIRGKIESNSYQYRQNLSVTLTFGISGFDPGKGSRYCIDEAEKALTQGKTQGMNQVVVYVPPKG